MIFDMRDSSPSSVHGSVHVIYHYVGDSADDACDEYFFNGAVRTTAGGIVGGDRLEEVHNILLDSGQMLLFSLPACWEKGPQKQTHLVAWWTPME